MGVSVVSTIPHPVPDPWLVATVTVPAARRGPPGTGNGGWVCGTVATHLGAGPVEVTLHAPTPLDVPLEVSVGGGPNWDAADH